MQHQDYLGYSFCWAGISISIELSLLTGICLFMLDIELQNYRRGHIEHRFII